MKDQIINKLHPIAVETQSDAKSIMKIAEYWLNQDLLIRFTNPISDELIQVISKCNKSIADSNVLDAKINTEIMVSISFIVLTERYRLFLLQDLSRSIVYRQVYSLLAGIPQEEKLLVAHYIKDSTIESLLI